MRISSFANTDRATLRAGLLAVAAAVIARVPQLGIPLMIDVPAYATIGAQIGNGLVPYRDIFDNKQPLIFGVLWVVDIVAPRSAFAIRIAGALVAGAAALAIFLLVKRIAGSARALAAAVLSGVMGASFIVEGIELNTEHLLVLTGTLAVLVPLALARRVSDPRFLLMAGVIGGLAVLTKAVAALTLPAALLPLVWKAWPDRRALGRTVALYALGVAIPVAVIAGVFALVGALGDFWYANVTYNFRYIELAAPQPLSSLARFPGELQILVAGAVLVAGQRLVGTRGRDPVSWTCLLWMAGALIGAKQGRREFAHYYAPLIPAATTLLCMPLQEVRKKFSFDRPHKPMAGWALASIALIALAAAPTVLDVGKTFGRSAMENGRTLWGSPVDFTKQQAEVGSWIEARADPDDELFVEGSWPAVYWGAGLKPATRYLYDFYLPQIEPDFYERTSAQLATDPPEWIVLFGDALLPDHINELQPSYEVDATFDSIFVLRGVGS